MASRYICFISNTCVSHKGHHVMVSVKVNDGEGLE